MIGDPCRVGVFPALAFAPVTQTFRLRFCNARALLPFLAFFVFEPRFSPFRRYRLKDVFGFAVPFPRARGVFARGAVFGGPQGRPVGVRRVIRRREPPAFAFPILCLRSFFPNVLFPLGRKPCVRNAWKSQFARVPFRAVFARSVRGLSQGCREKKPHRLAFRHLRGKSQLERRRRFCGISFVPVFRLSQNPRRDPRRNVRFFRFFGGVPTKANVLGYPFRHRGRRCGPFGFQSENVLPRRRCVSGGRMVFAPPQRRSDEFRRPPRSDRPRAFLLFRSRARFLNAVRPRALLCRMAIFEKDREARP